MNTQLTRIATLAIALALTGCIPGQKMSAKGPSTIVDSGQELSVTPITAELVAAKRQPVVLPAELTAFQPTSYEVAPGDTLIITVWDHPELTTPAGSQQQAITNGRQVQSDGTLFYPYAGKFKVGGLTVEQVRNTLETRLARYLKDPQVDVNVVGFGGRVSLQGAFTNTAPQDTTTVPQTLAQVIGRAGVDVVNANLSGLVLTRDGRNYPIDLDAINRDGVAQDIYLKPGDRVYLPYNDRNEVYVVGEARDPKAIPFKTSDMSLTQALGRAGGLNPGNLERRRGLRDPRHGRPGQSGGGLQPGCDLAGGVRRRLALHAEGGRRRVDRPGRYHPLEPLRNTVAAVLGFDPQRGFGRERPVRDNVGKKSRPMLARRKGRRRARPRARRPGRDSDRDARHGWRRKAGDRPGLFLSCDFAEALSHAVGLQQLQCAIVHARAVRNGQSRRRQEIQSHRLRLHRMRRRLQQVAGPVRRMRGLEHAERDRAGSRRRPARAAASAAQRLGRAASMRRRSPRCSDVRHSEEARVRTGIGEFDRVLGGGLVRRLGGAGRRRSGHRQVDAAAAGASRKMARRLPGLYVTGEESLAQVAGRAARLGLPIDGVHALAETGVERILEHAVDDAPEADRRRLGADAVDRIS